MFLFEQARKHGDYLAVVVGRDKTIEEVKGMRPKHDENERLRNVQELELVDEARLGNPGDKYRVIEDIGPDVICLGYDQDHFASRLPEELKKRRLDIKIVRIEAFKPERYKSSKLRD